MTQTVANYDKSIAILMAKLNEQKNGLIDWEKNLLNEEMKKEAQIKQLDLNIANAKKTVESFKKDIFDMQAAITLMIEDSN